MQTKTTRAFRTISEAAEELGLQPHVLRFWESKFSQIRPIKRAGGRRLYRPEDIDLLRGIKILLHEEKHPIKDVQKIIRLKGPNQVVELGRSIKRAARPLDVTDTVLIPERINSKPAKPLVNENEPAPLVATPPINAPQVTAQPTTAEIPPHSPATAAPLVTRPVSTVPVQALETPAPIQPARPNLDIGKLQSILSRLEALKAQWDQLNIKPAE